MTCLEFTQPLPNVAERPLGALHIVVSPGKFAQPFGTEGRNVRLAIWLAGWHIGIYHELRHPFALPEVS
jgi:transcription antitermination factor NusA-like protein